MKFDWLGFQLAPVMFDVMVVLDHAPPIGAEIKAYRQSKGVAGTESKDIIRDE